VFSQLFGVLLLFFTAGLRAAVRSREGGESSYSTVITVGGTVTALGIVLMSWVTFAAADAADSGASPTAVQALHNLASEAWIPWAVGATVLLIGVGLGGLRTLALPRWLSWATLVLGVLALTPGGIGVFIVMPLWLIVTGVALARRDRVPAVGRSAAPATA
jgi:hypothetical protein